MRASGVRLAVGIFVAVAFVALAAAAPAKTKKIASKVTIAFNDAEPVTSTGADTVDAFSGEVKAKKATCEKKRTVKVFRGADPLPIGSAKSDGTGAWRLALEDPGSGTYYAKVTKKRRGKKVCKADKSALIDIEDLDGPSGDRDSDGVAAPDDCDDTDPGRKPGAEETYDGVDEDCDGLADDIDQDGDGFITGEDCDDQKPLRNPGAIEDEFNGVDDDCDGSGDPSLVDGDADTVVGGADCDDTEPAANPGAPEGRNGIDEDCTGLSDDLDEDADGFNVPGDCDDTDPAANFEAVEVTGDGVDQDCDGSGE